MRKWMPQNYCKHNTGVWQDKADEEEQDMSHDWH